MNMDEHLYAIALTCLPGISIQQKLELYRGLGSAVNIYEHRFDIGAILDGCPKRLAKALKDWGTSLKQAETELSYLEKMHIRCLTPSDTGYPQRLSECADAPIVLYHKGNTDLNHPRVVSIGGGKCSNYGRDIIGTFIGELKELCPDVLFVSGLAEGAERYACRQMPGYGYPAVGVLSSGFERVNKKMDEELLSCIGLITELMSQADESTSAFVGRNRIVAGMSDACIVVESKGRDGGLIAAKIARSYGRDVFAFPGPVSSPGSMGCHALIRDNIAGLITSASDFVRAMNWQEDSHRQQDTCTADAVPFSEFTHEEQVIVSLLRETNDLPLNVLTVKGNMSSVLLSGLLQGLEEKGVVKPLAGGTYHLLKAGDNCCSSSV